MGSCANCPFEYLERVIRGEAEAWKAFIQRTAMEYCCCWCLELQRVLLLLEPKACLVLRQSVVPFPVAKEGA